MILKIFLPLSLAVIMFSLGLGLTLDDFKRVVLRPIAFAVGAVNQVVLLPIVAFVLVLLFALPPELAVGMMILSFSPGGVTTNILTKLARGDVALSVSLTAVISLLSIVTVPLLVAWSVARFMPGESASVNISGLALSMVAITAVPVLIGVAIRHTATAFAERIEPILSKIATGLFVVIVVGALAANWGVFVANLPRLGPALVALNVVLLALGFGISRILQRDESESKAIAIETGIQNGTLGITVGSLIAEQAGGLPPFSLPSAVYGITMYVVTLPVIYWMRARR